jgi:hypothetical protein
MFTEIIDITAKKSANSFLFLGNFM